MSERFPLNPRDLSREEATHFAGPSGSLEGLWRPVKSGAKTMGTVVVAHPHPSGGGSMLSKVVFHVARVLNHDLDLATLRFNFRGVGKSEGEHDEGRGEVEDVLAAWAEARRRVPGKPLIGAGFSFGAAMTVLAAASQDPLGDGLPRALAVLGLPVLLYPLPRPFPSPVPVAAAHGQLDEFTPVEAVERYLRSWPAPTAIHVEPEADHFLEGHLVATSGFLSRHIEKWL